MRNRLRLKMESNHIVTPSKYGIRRDVSFVTPTIGLRSLRHERSSALAWTILWDTEGRSEAGRWNTAIAQTEAEALDRAEHFLKLGFIVCEIRNPAGAVYMDEAHIVARFGGRTSAVNSRYE